MTDLPLGFFFSVLNKDVSGLSVKYDKELKKYHENSSPCYCQQSFYSLDKSFSIYLLKQIWVQYTSCSVYAYAYVFTFLYYMIRLYLDVPTVLAMFAGGLNLFLMIFYFPRVRY